MKSPIQVTNTGPNAPPPGWKSPLRNPDGTPKTLCQVVVEQTDGSGPLLVGPAIDRSVAETFAAEIKRQIIRGREKAWSNPHVVTVT